MISIKRFLFPLICWHLCRQYKGVLRSPALLWRHKHVQGFLFQLVYSGLLQSSGSALTQRTEQFRKKNRAENNSKTIEIRSIQIFLNVAFLNNMNTVTVCVQTPRKSPDIDAIVVNWGRGEIQILVTKFQRLQFTCIYCSMMS